MADELSDSLPRIPYRVELPTAEQVATLLAALTLVGPAMLGGIPVLPVTIDDERRRQQEAIQQESESTVGVYQSSQEAATALALSQQRLAAVTRETLGTTARTVTEADVVDAAHVVSAGAASPRQQQRFHNALGRVAYDSVDLRILEQDERDAAEVPAQPDLSDEAFWAEFE